MPYKSEAQRRYFNVNRKKLEAQGVDVDEWNQASKGKKLPEKKANTPGQTGNIPVTPPTPVRPEAAPSGNIPRPARRQTTLADGRGFEAMAAKEAATPFFYLLGDLAKMAAHVKIARPNPPKISYPQSELRPFKGGPGLEGLGKFRQPSMFDSLRQFATSTLGIGTGIGLGGLGALAYMNSRSRRNKDEEKRAEEGIPTFVGSKPKDLLSELKAFGDSMPQENGPLQGAARSVGNTIGGIFNPQGADPNYVAAARLGLQALLGSPDAKYKVAPHKSNNTLSNIVGKLKHLGDSMPQENGPLQGAARSVGDTIGGIFNPQGADPNSVAAARLGLQAFLGAPSAPAPAANPGLFNSLKQFATSPLGIAGLGLGTLGTGMYLGSQSFGKNDDEDEKKAGVKLLAKVAAKNRIKQAELAAELHLSYPVPNY